ncbi:hypothetical protein [Candidatus Finniella inopinata]|uniref:Uncharacterized protein n=1 Tax=Candidatus Finniella inopinata TaxID=1696036 RepID=A0A4Q7DJ34_9PROT|nr:hypothetical protein [Candidatus Finniella inopinata]RZI46034.1 hypothetical protein EQU50_03630 [Candidatus Finniella inopinata]
MTKTPTTFNLDRSIFHTEEKKASRTMVKEIFFSGLPALKGLTATESITAYRILVEKVEVSLQNKKGDALFQGLSLRIRDLTTCTVSSGMTILSRLQNIDGWCSKTMDHHWSVYRHACHLLDIAAQNEVDWKQASYGIAEAVAGHYEVIASTLDSLLHKFDELVLEQKENEESVEQYKAVLKVFSALTHDTPGLLEGAFDKKTLPEFLDHIGAQTLKGRDGMKRLIDLFFSISKSFIDLPNAQTGTQLSRKFQNDITPILAKYRDIATKKHPFGRCCP